MTRKALFITLILLTFPLSIEIDEIGCNNGDSLWETVISVQKACLWLLENQNADGSWGSGALEQARLTPLITDSLLSCGLPVEDERIAKALFWISRNRLSIREPASLAFAIDSFLRARREDPTLNSLIQSFISMQGEDGSWEQSIALTSIAILAIRSSQAQGIDESVDKACEYLFGLRINGTWPWDINGDERWVEPASYISVALAESGRYNESVHNAIQWLKGKSDPEGSWNSNVVTTALAAWAVAIEEPSSEEVKRALSWIRSKQNEDGSWASKEETGLVIFFLHRIVGSVPSSSLRPLFEIEVSPSPLLAVKGIPSLINASFRIYNGILIDPKVEVGSSAFLTILLEACYLNGEEVNLEDLARLYPGDVLEVTFKITAISDQELDLSIPLALSGLDFFGSPISSSSALNVRITKQGSPSIRVIISPEKSEIEEGEYVALLLQIENIGTAPAFSLNYSLRLNPSIAEVRSGDLNLSIERLDPGDKLSSAFVLRGLDPGDGSEMLSIEVEVKFIGGRVEERAGILVKKISFWKKYNNDIYRMVGLVSVLTALTSKYYGTIRRLLKGLRKRRIRKKKVVSEVR